VTRLTWRPALCVNGAGRAALRASGHRQGGLRRCAKREEALLARSTRLRLSAMRTALPVRTLPPSPCPNCHAREALARAASPALLRPCSPRPRPPRPTALSSASQPQLWPPSFAARASGWWDRLPRSSARTARRGAAVGTPLPGLSFTATLRWAVVCSRTRSVSRCVAQVRILFDMAREMAPSMIFIDEVRCRDKESMGSYQALNPMFMQI
jgi:hypothetical protein